MIEIKIDDWLHVTYFEEIAHVKIFSVDADVAWPAEDKTDIDIARDIVTYFEDIFQEAERRRNAKHDTEHSNHDR